MTDYTLKIVSHLDAEKDAILNGEFEKLDGFAREKTELFGKLAAGDVEVAAIRDAAQRNLRLLKSARNGVIEGQHKVAEMRRIRRGFAGYTAEGESMKTPTAQPNLRKTA